MLYNISCILFIFVGFRISWLWVTWPQISLAFTLTVMLPTLLKQNKTNVVSWMHKSSYFSIFPIASLCTTGVTLALSRVAYTEISTFPLPVLDVDSLILNSWPTALVPEPRSSHRLLVLRNARQHFSPAGGTAQVEGREVVWTKGTKMQKSGH